MRSAAALMILLVVGLVGLRASRAPADAAPPTKPGLVEALKADGLHLLSLDLRTPTHENGVVGEGALNAARVTKCLISCATMERPLDGSQQAAAARRIRDALELLAEQLAMPEPVLLVVRFYERGRAGSAPGSGMGDHHPFSRGGRTGGYTETPDFGRVLRETDPVGWYGMVAWAREYSINRVGSNEARRLAGKGAWQSARWSAPSNSVRGGAPVAIPSREP